MPRGELAAARRDRSATFRRLGMAPWLMLVLFATAGCHQMKSDNVMTLDIGGRQEITSPSPEQIRDAVLNLGPPGDAFLILGPTPMTYIQCSGDKNAGLNLEYQAETVDQHFRSKRNDWDAETVIQKFSQYHRGDDAWKEGVEWEKITW